MLANVGGTSGLKKVDGGKKDTFRKGRKFYREWGFI